MNATEETKTESNREKFKRLYIESLKEAVAKYPEQYYWPASDAEKVAARMLSAIENNTPWSHDSQAFKILAKKLGIKPTKTALLAAWNA
jgi:hypothetical protein